VVAVVGFAYFLVVGADDPQPLVDLRLFARRNFAVGVLALSVGYGLFFGNVVLLPLWLQQWMGYTATWAGLATAPVGCWPSCCRPGWAATSAASTRASWPPSPSSASPS
jgi:DHA2 family multidrug resistance protein